MAAVAVAVPSPLRLGADKQLGIGADKLVSYPDPKLRNDDHRLKYDIT